MTVTTGGAASAAPKRALYEYRGTNHDVTHPEGRTDSAPRTTPTMFGRNTAPSCSSCSAITERVVGGWWCASCEMAAG